MKLTGKLIAVMATAYIMGMALGVFAAEKRPLEFIGNHAFSGKELRQGLAASVDYDFAAHPLAKDDEFAKNLRHLLQVAYADRGYANVRVMVSRSGANGKWLVHINEGALFKCGKATVTAKDQLLAEELAAFLSQPIDVSEPDSFGNFNVYQEADWVEGQVAKLTRARLETLGWNARWFCLLKGHPETKAILRHRPREGGVMDLEVQMVFGKKRFGDFAGGLTQKLGEIQVHGCKLNTPKEVLGYLKLRPGVPTEGLMNRKLERALWRSGRFVEQRVDWRKADGKGAAGMDIHVKECPHAPPLRARLSDKAKAALAIHSELVNLKPGEDQWVLDFTVNATQAKQATRKQWATLLGSDHTRARVVFGGGASLAVRALTAKGGEALQLGVVAVPGKPFNVYLPRRKVKWETRDAGKSGGATVKITLMPPDQPAGRASFTINGLFSTAATKALDFQVVFPPAMILHEMHKPDSSVENFFVEDFKLVSAKTTVENSLKIHRIATVHRQTGQPLSVEYRANAQSEPVSLRMEAEWDGAKLKLTVSKAKDAMATLIRGVEADTKTHPNQYQPGHGFSSLAGFLAAHFVPAIYEWSDQTVNVFNEKNGLAGIAGRWVAESKLKLLQAVGLQLGEVLAPLDELFVSPGPFEIRTGILHDQPAPAVVSVDGRTELLPLAERTISLDPEGEEFDFKMRKRIEPNFSQLPGMFVALSAFRDQLFVEGSWPAVVLRETDLCKNHFTGHASAVLLQMAESGKAGPFACLMAAQLLNTLDSPAGIVCARLGLQRLNEKGIELDIRPFLAAQSPLVRTGDRLLGQAKPALREQIVSGIPAQFLNNRQKIVLADKLGGKEKIKSVVLLEPLLAGFLKQMIPSVANDLQIAQFGSLSRIREQAAIGDAGSQFMLALLSFQGRGLPLDLVEAYVWATRAARQSHPDATRLRIQLIRQMTPDQLAEGSRRILEKK